MKDTSDLLKCILICMVFSFIFAWLLTCDRTETKTTTTKKQGKTELVKSTETITFDTLHWIANYKANTKPVIKWVKPKTIHDTIEVKPSFSPCDSIFASIDSGSTQGVRFAIVDTISDNRVIGRSIKLEVPQLTISKNTINTNDSLRVDTVYINQKQKWGTNAKWFLKGFGLGNITGFIGGAFLPK